MQVISGGKSIQKPSQPDLSDRLRSLAAKCDSKGNLPPECSGELFQLMFELLKMTQDTNREIELLSKRGDEIDKRIDELISINQTEELLIHYVEMFLDERNLAGEFTAYLDDKLNEMPDNVITLN